MLKSFCGGSATVTGALLLASVIFYARPSVAETLAAASVQETQSQVKEKTIEPDTAQEVGTLTVSATPKAQQRREPAAAVRPELNIPASFSPVGDNAARESFGAAQSFVATAYALRGRTASGESVRRGLIAADRGVLPLGSRVRLEAGPYSGEYTVADRGSAVRGRKIDIWVPSNGEALRFGRRTVKLTVLSYGARRRTPRRRS